MPRKLFLLLALFLCGIYSCARPLTNYVYRIARDIDIHTYQLADREKNLLGFSDELIVTIADKEGFYVQFLASSTANLIEGLDQGFYDAMLTDMRPTGQLEEKYVFSDVYLFLGPVLVVRKDSPVTSIEEMDGKTVGIETGTSMVFDVEKYPSLLIFPYENVFDALEKLSNYQLDGVIMGPLAAHIYIPSIFNNQLKIASKPLTKEGFRMVAKKTENGQKLIELFNTGLKQAMSESSYSNLMKKWNVYNPNK